MRFILLAAALPLFTPARAQDKPVNFTAKDGCRLEASFSAPAAGAFVFVNTHGLGSDRHEWGPFEAALKEKGYGWLSLDMRGHGGSRTCAGKPADHKKFTRADWAAASRDIEAAAAWLKKKGHARMVFCGASIGANLSLKAAAGAVKPAAVILLSPGLDYAGTRAEDYLPGFTGKILIAAAEDDPYAWQSAARLSLAAGRAGKAAAAIDGGSGHGANMLKAPGVTGKILDWVSGLK